MHPGPLYAAAAVVRRVGELRTPRSAEGARCLVEADGQPAPSGRIAEDCAGPIAGDRRRIGARRAAAATARGGRESAEHRGEPNRLPLSTHAFNRATDPVHWTRDEGKRLRLFKSGLRIIDVHLILHVQGNANQCP